MRKTILTLVAVMAVLFVSCGGGGSNEPIPDNIPEPNPQITSLDISPKSMVIHIDEPKIFSVKICPAGIEHSCNWYIYMKGNAVPADPYRRGTDTILFQPNHFNDIGDYYVAVKEEYSGLADTCHLTITDEPAPIEKILFDKSEIELYKGQEDKLTVTVAPEYATTRNILWTSENEDIAKVSFSEFQPDYVTVISVSPGTTYIVATPNEGNVVAKCKVTVKNNNQIEYHPYDDDTQW